MIEQVFLSDGLATMPPGPDLARMLAGIDRTRLADADTVTVAQAQLRQVSHEQAQLLADLREVALACRLRPDDPARHTDTDVGAGAGGDEEDLRWAVMELSAALTWTRTATNTQVDLALRLACHVGWGDRPRHIRIWRVAGPPPHAAHAQSSRVRTERAGSDQRRGPRSRRMVPQLVSHEAVKA